MAQSLKGMLSQVQAAQNPQAMMNQLLARNPQLNQVLSFVQKCGGDPQKAFYALAEQKGVDPDEILSMLR